MQHGKNAKIIVILSRRNVTGALYVCVICLGLKELSPPNLNLLHILQNETQASEPILFILSLGADPSQELQDLAKSTFGAEKYHQVCDCMSAVVVCDVTPCLLGFCQGCLVK